MSWPPSARRPPLRTQPRRLLRVAKAVRGPTLKAPVGQTKSGSAGWREVWQDELWAWLDWRLAQATAEKRLAGEVALFWNPTARNRAKCWTPEPMRKEWYRACTAAGVRISLYRGTKHTTATALGEGGLSPLILKALGGWKRLESVEPYTRLKATRKAIVQALPKKESE